MSIKPAGRKSTDDQGVTVATGKKASSDAAKILRDPKSSKKEKEVAASDLAQRKGGAVAKPKKK